MYGNRHRWWQKVENQNATVSENATSLTPVQRKYNLWWQNNHIDMENSGRPDFHSFAGTLSHEHVIIMPIVYQ